MGSELTQAAVAGIQAGRRWRIEGLAVGRWSSFAERGAVAPQELGARLPSNIQYLTPASPAVRGTSGLGWRRGILRLGLAAEAVAEGLGGVFEVSQGLTGLGS